MTSAETIPWMSSARASWLADVRRWITERAEALDLGAVTDIAVTRERTWGAIARVETAHRILFFKAQAGRARLEPVLVTDIAARWPTLGPNVLAADLSRAWLLLDDHGKPMSLSLDPPDQIRTFEQIIPQYAELQRESRESADLIEHWLVTGAPDRRMANLPGLLDRLLSGELWGGPLPLRPDDYRAIEETVPDLNRVCDELAATPFSSLTNQREAVARFLIRWAGARTLLGRDADLIEAVASQAE